jgi:flagellin
MRELAVQAASGTLSDSQREYLGTEFDALDSQMQNTISNTKWNGFSVLTNGTSNLTFTIQTGTDINQTVVITSNFISLAPAADISRASSASSAIASVDTSLGQINTARATLGAVINRLNATADNLTNISQNVSESRSRILDTDYAAATTELARTQIIAQAGMAVLAQANQQPQTVLSLLR